MDGRERKNIKKGTKVAILQKQDERSGNLTHGVVQEVIDEVAFHLKGIECKLKTGQIGRVKLIKL
ncbi:YwbE family protein [Plebeiibacterium marinum]|uniref:YwbE family protein n=1 Tax=Plebeiibacterium marinum TaxID=2992111 RepID=A0AAE3MDL9_9BACT|nr:YwbE family protein [Plebeiobacterium marinum]MCW3805858.1 YwbE family protein [Plebeiobacterium marinum]